MGGNIGAISPEFKAFMDEVAQKEIDANVHVTSHPPKHEPVDEHEEWRRMNLGTDR